MAKVYLETTDTSFIINDSNVTIYGANGNQAISITSNAANVAADQNIEKVIFTGVTSSYTYAQTGNQIGVYKNGALIAIIPLQGDVGGTEFQFSNGTTNAILTNGVMSLGGGTISATPSSVVVTDPAITTIPASLDKVISLGSMGLLISPIQIDTDGDGAYDSWFYYWDRSGDGTSASAGTLNGGSDKVSHDVLDSIFREDSTAYKGGTDTNNTYRYATIDGIRLALPTLGNNTTLNQNSLLDNQNHTDLAEIWDTFNGDGQKSATPAGWGAYDYYWSATTLDSQKHEAIDFVGGYIRSDSDTQAYLVALQVI